MPLRVIYRKDLRDNATAPVTQRHKVEKFHVNVDSPGPKLFKTGATNMDELCFVSRKSTDTNLLEK